jgi:hypothetical protein
VPKAKKAVGVKGSPTGIPSMHWRISSAVLVLVLMCENIREFLTNSNYEDSSNPAADGPFAGIEAIFKTADAESRSMILLDMLSKPVAMRIETTRLRKAG